jgi:hypothetical protein
VSPYPSALMWVRERGCECDFPIMNTFPDPLHNLQHKCNFHDTSCPNMALTLSRSSALTVEPSMPTAASVATTSSRASGRGGEDDVPAVGCFREVVLLARLRLRLLLRLLLLERRRRWWGLLERRRLFCLGLRSRSLCRDLPRSLRLLSLCLSWLERNKAFSSHNNGQQAAKTKEVKFTQKSGTPQRRSRTSRETGRATWG